MSINSSLANPLNEKNRERKDFFQQRLFFFQRQSTSRFVIYIYISIVIIHDESNKLSLRHVILFQDFFFRSFDFWFHLKSWLKSVQSFYDCSQFCRSSEESSNEKDQDYEKKNCVVWNFAFISRDLLITGTKLLHLCHQSEVAESLITSCDQSLVSILLLCVFVDLVQICSIFLSVVCRRARISKACIGCMSLKLLTNRVHAG
jgi:hypothetical protein